MVFKISEDTNGSQVTSSIPFHLSSSDAFTKISFISSTVTSLFAKKVKSITNKNGIAPEDEITKVNGKEIEGKLADILKDYKKEVTFTIKKKFSEKEISLAIGNHYQLLEIVKSETATDEQLVLRKVWSK